MAMAGKQISPNDVEEKCDVRSDYEAGLEDFTRREEYAPAGESYTSARPQCGKISESACASHVEAWINQEFGDDVDPAHTMHDNDDEADSYTTLSRQVDGFIESDEFTHTANPDSVFDDHFDDESENSEEPDMCYEPQLWSFK